MNHGMWYARSAEFLHQGYMEKLVWMRVLGDTIFSAGVGGLVWFIIGLKTGKSYVDDTNKSTNDKEK
jgi:nitric oxide reductase subunit B